MPDRPLRRFSTQNQRPDLTQFDLGAVVVFAPNLDTYGLARITIYPVQLDGESE